MVFDEKKIIEYPRFSQYSALFNVIRAYKLIFIGKIRGQGPGLVTSLVFFPCFIMQRSLFLVSGRQLEKNRATYTREIFGLSYLLVPIFL